MKKKQAKEQYINIPYSIMMRSDLSQSQKIIYGFVNGFQDNNVCYASNTYIGEVLNLSPDGVSRCVSTLIRSGLIKALAPKGRSRSLFTTVPPSITSGTPVDKVGLTPTLRSGNNIVNNIKNNIVNNIDSNVDANRLHKVFNTEYDLLSKEDQQYYIDHKNTNNNLDF